MGVEEKNQIPLRSQNGVNTSHPQIRQPLSQPFGSPDPSAGEICLVTSDLGISNS